MSGIITLVIALILLVAAVYNLISYIRDRRSASLPSKKNQALKVVKAVFSLPRRDWPAHLFALLRAQKAPADRQGPQFGREPRCCRPTRRALCAQGDWRTPSGAYLRHS